MLAAWRDFSSFRGEDAPQFSVWLRTILLRKISAAVASHLKSAKRDAQREQCISTAGGSSVVEVTKGLPGREDTPSRIVSIGEETQLIRRLLEKLPEEYALVIRWRNIEGFNLARLPRV